MNFLFLFLTTAPIAETISENWDSPGILFAKVAAIAALVGLNGFFVAAEFALVKVRRSQLDTLTAEGNRRAVAGRHVIENLTAYLSACQLGITLASLGLGWLGEPFLARILQPLFFRLGVESAAVITSISFALAFSIITALHIVLRTGTKNSRYSKIVRHYAFCQSTVATFLCCVQAVHLVPECIIELDS